MFFSFCKCREIMEKKRGKRGEICDDCGVNKGGEAHGAKSPDFALYTAAPSMGATFVTSRSTRRLRSDGANDGGELSRARMREIRYIRVERDVSNVASMARVRAAHARCKAQHICTFAHSHILRSKKASAARCVQRTLGDCLEKSWRRPTLPRVCSTIGAIGLNFSVRNGKRWNPNAITTRIGVT